MLGVNKTLDYALANHGMQKIYPMKVLFDPPQTSSPEDPPRERRPHIVAKLVANLAIEIQLCLPTNRATQVNGNLGVSV